MAKLKTYKNISRPYDSFLNRDSSVASSSPATSKSSQGDENFSGGVGGASGSSDINGGVEETAVKSSGGISDVWIKTFIRSTNWKPKTRGFNIDGRTGYAEFTNVFVSGEIEATSGTIGGSTITTNYISSTNFLSGPLGYGWRIWNNGTAEFQNVTTRGILRTSVFEKDTISAVGGIVLVSNADVLDEDMTILNNSTLKISGESSFSENEVIRIKDGVDDEWMLVTDVAAAPVYTVTRDLASDYTSNVNPAWKKGTAVASMGIGSGSKTGFVLIDSASANSPYIDVYGRNSNTYSDYTLHGRWGWLKGVTDSDVGLDDTDVWGLYTDNAYIKGVIVADTGKIGGTSGWTIASGSISSVNAGNTTTMASGGTNAFIAGTTGSPQFKVTHAGVMTATSGTFSGAISAATIDIGGADSTSWHVDSSANMWWGSSATYAGASIKISSAGKAYLSGAVISGAITITGGSGISNLSDAGSLATLDVVGASNCNSTIISGGKIITGLLTATNIQAGTLTGRTINANSGSGTDVQMNNNGVIYFKYGSNTKGYLYCNTSGQVILDGDDYVSIVSDGSGDAVYLKADDLLADCHDLVYESTNNTQFRCDQFQVYYNEDDDDDEAYWLSDGNQRMVLDHSGNLDIDGDMTADGYNDFGEWFESVDGKKIENGISVVLEDGKIREAEAGEIPIGVISATAGIVLNSGATEAGKSWGGKYLKNEFGEDLYEEAERWNMRKVDIGKKSKKDVKHEKRKNLKGWSDETTPPKGAIKSMKKRKIINPDYNKDLEYIPRRERDEWNIVGLLGQVKILKGQPVAPNWIKLRNISDTVEEWLIK